MSTAIQISGLKKSYGSQIVLKGLDFHIEQGEVFALLGVNGAGKTTALECIEGLRSYDAGTVVVNGKMGIQLQSSSLPAHIKPMEAIKLFANGTRAKLTIPCWTLSISKKSKENSTRSCQRGRKGGCTLPSP